MSPQQAGYSRAGTQSRVLFSCSGHWGAVSEESQDITGTSNTSPCRARYQRKTLLQPPAAAAAPGCREMAVWGSCEQPPGCPASARFWHPSALLPYLCQRCSLLWPQPSGPCKVIISVPAEQQLCDAIWKGRWRCQAPCSESWDVQERRQRVTCTAWAAPWPPFTLHLDTWVATRVQLAAAKDAVQSETCCCCTQKCPDSSYVPTKDIFCFQVANLSSFHPNTPTLTPSRLASCVPAVHRPRRNQTWCCAARRAVARTVLPSLQRSSGLWLSRAKALMLILLLS